jgi:hypothetical protein
MRHALATILTIPLILSGCGAGSDTVEPDLQAMPDEWAGIRLHVVDSETGDGQIIDVTLGETVALGDSGLTLSADTFVPDFVMDERGITSRSAETHNPAARVVITEEGKADYEGWLFAAMPEIHPFPHERCQVLLVEGIPAE